MQNSLLAQELSMEQTAEAAYNSRNFEEAEKIWKEVAIEKAKDNDVKFEVIALLNMVKCGMHISKYDTSAHYARIAYEKAKSNALIDEYGQAMDALTYIFEFQNQNDSIIKICTEILETGMLSHSYYSNAYTSMASVYSSQGSIELEEEFLNKAIDLDRLHADSSSLPFNLISLGTLKTGKNLHHEALELYYEAIEYTRPGTDEFKLPSMYCYIASLFRTLQNFEKSKEYGQKALRMCEKLNLSFTKVRALNQLGATAQKQEKYNEALEFYMKSDSIYAAKGGRLSFQTNTKINIAECLLALNQFEITKDVIEKVRPVLATIKDSKERLSFAILDAEYALKFDKSKTLSKLKIVDKYCKELQDQHAKIKLNNLYAAYYRLENNFELSSKYSAKANILKDSIYRNEQAFIVHNLEALYQKKEQESAISLLAAQNGLQNSKLKQQRQVIIGSTIGLFIFGFLLSFIFSLLKKVRLQKAVVENSLGEKEVLLKEIHHRVKNNLQVISSLLALQANYIDDLEALDALQQGQDRVYSMSLIHQFLYEGKNLIGVETNNYFEQLADNLAHSYNVDGNVIMKLQIEEMQLDVDTMIPLGLIVNELVSNAFKHAFKENTKTPEISIHLNRKNEKLILKVKDNGESIADTSNIEGKSFGFELIKAFAKKMQAQIEMKVQNGLVVQLHIEKYKVAA